MSTLSSLIDDALSVIYPAYCLGCGELIGGRAVYICMRCRATMPATYFHLEEENPMAIKIKSFCPSVVNAAAHFYYVQEGKWRKIIHKIKYHNEWGLAVKLGYWYGSELVESPLYQDVDVIVPIPLHWTKHAKRRYNQSEKIARGMADAMGLDVNTKSLRRVHNNPSQVTRQKDQRWKNVKGIFGVRKPELLEGKHVLIVDDVYTTGATLLSAIETVQAAVPTCRISVVTLAASRNEVVGRAI